MKTLKIDLLTQTIGSLNANLFYNTAKKGVDNPSSGGKSNKFSFKWEGSYEASLTK